LAHSPYSGPTFGSNRKAYWFGQVGGTDTIRDVRAILAHKRGEITGASRCRPLLRYAEAPGPISGAISGVLKHAGGVVGVNCRQALPALLLRGEAVRILYPAAVGVFPKHAVIDPVIPLLPFIGEAEVVQHYAMRGPVLFEESPCEGVRSGRAAAILEGQCVELMELVQPLVGASSAGRAGGHPESYHELRGLMGRLANQGAFREAVSVMMLALVRWLEHLDILRFHHSKTNGDYVREYGAGRWGREDFRRFVIAFDASVYSGAPCGRDAYESLNAIFERTISCTDPRTHDVREKP
jgi:hypothetical protein